MHTTYLSRLPFPIFAKILTSLVHAAKTEQEFIRILEQGVKEKLFNSMSFKKMSDDYPFLKKRLQLKARQFVLTNFYTTAKQRENCIDQTLDEFIESHSQPAEYDFALETFLLQASIAYKSVFLLQILLEFIPYDHCFVFVPRYAKLTSLQRFSLRQLNQDGSLKNFRHKILLSGIKLLPDTEADKEMKKRDKRIYDCFELNSTLEDNGYLYSLLHIAIEESWLEGLELLVNENPMRLASLAPKIVMQDDQHSLNTYLYRPDYGDTLLHLAALKSNTTMLDKLMALGFSSNLCNNHGLTPAMVGLDLAIKQLELHLLTTTNEALSVENFMKLNWEPVFSVIEYWCTKISLDEILGSIAKYNIAALMVCLIKKLSEKYEIKEQTLLTVQLAVITQYMEKKKPGYELKNFCCLNQLLAFGEKQNAMILELCKTSHYLDYFFNHSLCALIAETRLGASTWKNRENELAVANYFLEFINANQLILPCKFLSQFQDTYGYDDNYANTTNFEIFMTVPECQTLKKIIQNILNDMKVIDKQISKSPVFQDFFKIHHNNEKFFDDQFQRIFKKISKSKKDILNDFNHFALQRLYSDPKDIVDSWVMHYQSMMGENPLSKLNSYDRSGGLFNPKYPRSIQLLLKFVGYRSSEDKNKLPETLNNLFLEKNSGEKIKKNTFSLQTI